MDIAIECASTHGADPSTLIRGARDFRAKDPKFASTVALLALKSLLAGGGYDPQVSEARDAATHRDGSVVRYSVSVPLGGPPAG